MNSKPKYYCIYQVGGPILGRGTSKKAAFDDAAKSFDDLDWEALKTPRTGDHLDCVLAECSKELFEAENNDCYEEESDVIVVRNHDESRLEIEALFTDEDPEGWAHKYYSYGEGNQLVFQVEVWRDPKKAKYAEVFSALQDAAIRGMGTVWQFGWSKFRHGTGAHSRDYHEAEGPKFCVHIESGYGFEELDTYFKEHFGIGISDELKDWVKAVQASETFLQEMVSVEEIIRNGENAEEAREAIKKDYPTFLTHDVIVDVFDEKFEEPLTPAPQTPISLKAEVYRTKKDLDLKNHEALEVVAQRHGYSSWHELTKNQTKAKAKNQGLDLDKKGFPKPGDDSTDGW